jgi:hypothetical protein
MVELVLKSKLRVNGVNQVGTGVDRGDQTGLIRGFSRSYARETSSLAMRNRLREATTY